MMAEPAKYQGWIVSGIFNGLQKLSIPVFGIITTMILAKQALTKAEMGVWALFLVVTSFIELIRQALVKTSLIKFMNHSEEGDQKYILSAAFLLNTIITFSLVLLLFFCSGYFAEILHAPELERMMYLFIPGILMLIPFSHFEWIMYGKSDFKGLFSTFFFRQAVTLALMAIYLMFYGKISLDLLVLFYTVGILLGTFVGYRYIKSYLSFIFSFRKKWFTRLWHFGKYVFGSGISTLVFANAGQMMLSPILGSTVFTASQSIAARVINLSDMPSQVLSDILFPKSAKKEIASNKELVKYYYEKTVGATLCFNIPVVAFILIFPKFIILFLGSSEYLDAVPYLQIIAMTGIFLAFLKQWGVILDSGGRPHINFRLITFLAITNVILSYIFIRYSGFLGAAYALLLSHVIGFIVTQILLYRYYGINFINCFKYAFKFYPELSNMLLGKVQMLWKKR